jgi:hypothetical protein
MNKLITLSFLATALFLIFSSGSGWISPLAFAKTSYVYCYVASTDFNSSGGSYCFKSKDDCKKAESSLTEDWKLIKSCTKVTVSNQPASYCYSLLPNDGKRCYGSKKACEDARLIFEAGPNGYRAGPNCYKI